ncbi:MAG TPA: SPOR domain-containing protein [Rhizomicrobium sp.]|nr:SPOR domain-containing protein [Rhizomicrobium sp.]
MANMGRRTYEPPGDDVHIFDASEDDEDVEGSRLPLLIAIALFVLAAFGAVVWLAYTQGVQRGRSDAPRIIAAEKGPAKVAATGNTGDSGFKGLKIYQQPAPVDEDEGQDAAPQSAPAPKSEPPAAMPETTVMKPPAGSAASEAADRQHAATAAAPASPPPLKPSVQASAPEATAPPARLAPAASQAPAAQTPAAQSAVSGGYTLQIGSYKSRADADAAWKTYKARHAATLGGYSQDVKAVDLGAKGTWYRLRVGSFADRSAAQALCARLTAEGGACFPSR